MEAIPLGTDFREFLNKQVEQCDVLLTVIGDRWLELLEAYGQMIRTDFVRIEIEVEPWPGASQSLPVLVGKATNAQRGSPPRATLRTLAYRHAAQVHAGPDMNVHLRRLTSRMWTSLLSVTPTGRGRPRAAPTWEGDESSSTGGSGSRAASF